MNYVLENITPARAKKYLELNTCNRKIRTTWVSRIARDIIAGRWVVNHQGIAFDTRGRLSDGQHRLLAVIEAGRSVKMWVAYDEAVQARVTIDQGGPRTVVDISGPLVGEGVGVNKDEAATARQMFCSVAKSNFSITQSNQEKLQYILKHQEAIQFACQNLRGKDVKHACFRAVVARAWYSSDHARLAEFCEILNTGIVGRPQDIAPGRLRSYWLANKPVFNGANGRATLYRKTEMALRAFLSGRPIEKIVEVETEVFPIPGDEDDGTAPSLFDVPGNGGGGIRGTDAGYGQARAARPYNNP